VRRGWPTARISGRKRYLVTRRRTFSWVPRPPQRVRQGQTCRGGHPPSPSQFPRARSAGTMTPLRGSGYRLGAPRGDRGPSGSAIQRPQRAGISRCSSVGVANCQPSTEPIRRRCRTNPERHQATRRPQTPEGARNAGG
jgi:hypothetical protein